MKDFTQKFLCLILSLATVLSLSAPAFAADYSSAETLDGSLTSTLDYSNVKLSNSKELGVENINNELREIFPYGEIVSIIETPYGMAFYVDKNYHNPIKPRTIWDALDVVMAGASWADFFKEPSLANLGWAALDTVSLLPILPSSAYIRKGGKLLLNVDEVKKLAKTPEGLEKIKKALKATDKVSDILEAGRKLAKKYTLSDSVYRDHIVKLHSFYSKEKNKSKFIVLPLEKPCNIRRFRLSNPQTVCTFPCFFPYGLKQGKDFYSPLTTLSSSRAELRFASLVEWA